MAKIQAHEKQRVATLRYRAVELLYRVLTPLMYVVGVHPRAPVMMLRFGRKGGFVRHWRGKTQ